MWTLIGSFCVLNFIGFLFPLTIIHIICIYVTTFNTNVWKSFICYYRAQPPAEQDALKSSSNTPKPTTQQSFSKKLSGEAESNTSARSYPVKSMKHETSRPVSQKMNRGLSSLAPTRQISTDTSSDDSSDTDTWQLDLFMSFDASDHHIMYSWVLSVYLFGLQASSAVINSGRENFSTYNMIAVTAIVL